MDLEPFHRINPWGYQGPGRHLGAVTWAGQAAGRGRNQPDRRDGATTRPDAVQIAAAPPFHIPTETPRRVAQLGMIDVKTHPSAGSPPRPHGPALGTRLGSPKIARTARPLPFADPAQAVADPRAQFLGPPVATPQAKQRFNRLVTVCEDASCSNIHVSPPGRALPPPRSPARRHAALLAQRRHPLLVDRAWTLLELMHLSVDSDYGPVGGRTPWSTACPPTAARRIPPPASALCAPPGIFEIPPDFRGICRT